MTDRSLSKIGVGELHAIFGEELRQHMTDKESMTHSTLIDLAEDAVDMALARARSACSAPGDSTVGPTARSSLCQPELRIDPTAHTAIELDHVGDEVAGPGIETNSGSWQAVVHEALREHSEK